MKLDEENLKILNKLYALIKCDSIWLYKNSSGSKILSILVRDEGKYYDLIIFSEDKYTNSTDEFSPGWYYETVWCT